jgi:hypothetical protein
LDFKQTIPTIPLPWTMENEKENGHMEYKTKNVSMTGKKCTKR